MNRRHPIISRAWLSASKRTAEAKVQFPNRISRVNNLLPVSMSPRHRMIVSDESQSYPHVNSHLLDPLIFRATSNKYRSRGAKMTRRRMIMPAVEMFTALTYLENRACISIPRLTSCCGAVVMIEFMRMSKPLITHLRDLISNEIKKVYPNFCKE